MQQIRFTCQHCKKALKVPARLAGRKGPCPACKKAITVPSESVTASATTSKPAPTPEQEPTPEPSGEDLEKLVADALIDEPEEQQEESGPIKMECSYCFEEIEFPASLAGKRGPCPECSRILKIPELEKKKKKDWRNVRSDLPSGAAQNMEEAPEGAWDTRAGKVSGQALVEAGVIQEEDEPLSARQWIARGLTLAVVLAVLGGGGLYVWNLLTAGKIEDALARAMQSISGEQLKERKLSVPQLAIVHLSAAKFYLSSNSINTVKGETAKDGSLGQLQIARQQLLSMVSEGNPFRNQCEVLLSELALIQTRLAGNSDQQRDGQRITWEKTLPEIAQSIRRIETPTMRAIALRRVTRKLLELNQLTWARALPTAVDPLPVIGPPLAADPKDVERPENQALTNLAIVAQEFWRAGKQDDAKKMITQILGAYPKPNSPRKPVLPLLSVDIVSTCQALAGKIPASDAAEDKNVIEIGKAIAPAWVNQLPQALEAMKALPTPEGRFLAALGIAEATRDKTAIESARAIFADGVKDRISPWNGFDLFHVGLEAKLDATQLKALLPLINAGDLRAWCQWAMIDRQLQSSTAPMDLSTLQVVPVRSLAYDYGLAQLTAHNVQHGEEMDQPIEGLDKNKQPFGYIGIANGMLINQQQ